MDKEELLYVKDALLHENAEDALEKLWQYLHISFCKALYDIIEQYEEKRDDRYVLKAIAMIDNALNVRR